MSENSNEFTSVEDVEGHLGAFTPDPGVEPDEDDVEGHVQPRRDLDVER